MFFELPSLPYSYHALEPYIGKQTLKIHHNVLQKRYVQKLNTLTRGTQFDHLPLEQIIVSAPPDSPIYDNAAQVFNHTFLWHSMRPKGGGTPRRDSGFARALSHYGALDEVKSIIKETAVNLFGSGWVWLAADENGFVHVWAGEDGDNPMRYGYRPILCIDVWEHAYFLDYQAERGKYIDVFMDKLVNWRFAEANYERAFGL
jgi:Fe-Mn family superoxide dismutase